MIHVKNNKVLFSTSKAKNSIALEQFVLGFYLTLVFSGLMSLIITFQ